MSIASTFMNIEENPRSVYASEENLKVSINLTGIESNTGERVVSVCVCVLCMGFIDRSKKTRLNLKRHNQLFQIVYSLSSGGEP